MIVLQAMGHSSDTTRLGDRILFGGYGMVLLCGVGLLGDTTLIDDAILLDKDILPGITTLLLSGQSLLGDAILLNGRILLCIRRR